MPARRISAVVLAGVVCGNALAASGVFSFRALAPLVLAAGWALIASRDPRIRVAGAVAAAFILGAGSLLAQSGGDPPLAELAREVPRCTATGIVLESRGGLGTFARVDKLVCANGQHRSPGIIVFEGEGAFPGSSFIVSGQLVPLGGEDFDRARADAGADASMNGHPRFAPPQDLWRASAYRLRTRLTNAASVLPLREGSLLTGLTIGDTGRMSPADEQIYRDTGLAHLVAVSGSNIAIVVGSVLLVMARRSLWARLFVAATVLVMYVTVVGPDASVLRAGVMGALALIALAAGRRHEVLSTLAYALSALLIVRPEMLDSLGLQLSAAATAGLALWSGRLAAHLARLPRVIGFTLAATLAAQFAVAPLLVHHFERLSLVAPLANLLALPAVAAATLLGLGGGVLAALSPAAGSLVMHLAYPFVWWIVEVADATALPGWASMDVPASAAFPLAVVTAAATLALKPLRRDAVTSGG